MSRIPVSVLGATGVVGQRFVRRLAEHPWFELRHLAASPRSAGLSYGEACVWRIPGPAHAGFGDRKVVSCTPEGAFAPLVFSALDADTAREVEPAFARAGETVTSGQDRLLAYALTNTLLYSGQASRICFFVGGNEPAGFSGEIDWTGYFYQNNGMVEK